MKTIHLFLINFIYTATSATFDYETELLKSETYLQDIQRFENMHIDENLLFETMTFRSAVNLEIRNRIIKLLLGVNGDQLDKYFFFLKNHYMDWTLDEKLEHIIDRFNTFFSDNKNIEGLFILKKDSDTKFIVYNLLSMRYTLKLSALLHKGSQEKIRANRSSENNFQDAYLLIKWDFEEQMDNVVQSFYEQRPFLSFCKLVNSKKTINVNNFYSFINNELIESGVSITRSFLLRHCVITTENEYLRVCNSFSTFEPSPILPLELFYYFFNSNSQLYFLFCTGLIENIETFNNWDAICEKKYKKAVFVLNTVTFFYYKAYEIYNRNNDSQSLDSDANKLMCVIKKVTIKRITVDYNSTVNEIINIHKLQMFLVFRLAMSGVINDKRKAKDRELENFVQSAISILKQFDVYIENILRNLDTNIFDISD